MSVTPQQPPPPPGWHEDPQDSTSLRYWDGTKWTENRAPRQQLPPPSPPSPSSTSSPWTGNRIAGAVGAGAIIIGSVSPWATATTAFGTINANGTDGDGVITLVGGGVVLLLIILAKFLGATIVSALTGAILVYDLVNVSRNLEGADSEFVRTSVGWGLWLAAIGAAVAFASSLILRGSTKATGPADATDS